MDRYTGKPFLRLLDCYVLNAIGALGSQQAAALAAMEPKLGEVYGMSGGWQDIVVEQMGFPHDLPVQIRAIWDAGKARATQLGQAVDPQEFARQFVDTNFTQ